MKNKRINKGFALITVFSMVFNMFVPFITFNAIDVDQSKAILVLERAQQFIEHDSGTHNENGAVYADYGDGNEGVITSDCALYTHENGQVKYVYTTEANCDVTYTTRLASESWGSRLESKNSEQGEYTELVQNENAYSFNGLALGSVTYVNHRFYNNSANVSIFPGPNFEYGDVSNNTITLTSNNGTVVFTSTGIAKIADQDGTHLEIASHADLSIVMTPANGKVAQLWNDGVEVELAVNDNVYTKTFTNVKQSDFLWLDFRFNDSVAPGPGNEKVYNVNFGTASWTIGEGNGAVTVTASVNDKTINTNSPIAISENEEIVLTNFDNSKMDVVVGGPNQFTAFLGVYEGVTKFVYVLNDTNIPSEDVLSFNVVEKNNEPGPIEPGPSNELNIENGKLALVFDDHSDRYHNGKICYKIGTGAKTCLTESDYVDISNITNGTVNISIELGSETELDTGHMELMNNAQQDLFSGLNPDTFMTSGYTLDITNGAAEGYKAKFEFRYYGERPVQIGKTVINSDGSGNGSIIWTSQGAVGNVNHNEVELNNNEAYTLNIKLNFDDNEARIRRFEIKKGNVQNNVFVDWITSTTTNTAAMAAALTPEGYNLNVNAGDTYLIEAIFDSLYEMMTFRNATAIMDGDNVVGAKYENVNVDGYSATISLKGYNNDGTEVVYENQPNELRFMFSSQKLGGAYLVPEFSECKEGNNNVSCDEFASRVALVYRDLNVLPYKYGNDNFYTIRIPETYGETTFNGAEFDENSFGSKYLSAYYVWMCGENDSKVCFHKFENLYNREAIVDIDGFTQVDFKVTYIKDTDITNQNDNGVNENFTFTNKMTNDGMWLDQNQVDNNGNVIRNAGPETLSNWVLAKNFRIENEVPVNYGMEEDNGELRNDLTRTVIFGPDNCDEYDQQCKDDRGIQLDPVGGKIGKYSVSTNGDRNFRATIYKEGYVGLSFNASIRDFTYFPSFWDTVFFDPSVEISGSTKENAAVYSTYLLEPTLQIKKTTATAATIESITALDVNPDAVTITKNGDTFDIVFNSKYYDQVVLEIKDSEYASASENDKINHIYYLRVSRDILDVYRRDNKIIGTLYYPVKKDENHEFDYTDFDIIATINYKDGTTKVINATPVLENSSIGGDMIEAYRFKGGNNLYASTYGVDYNSNIESVYFNVLEKGALTGNTYGGTFSGSDKGYEWRNQ